MKYHKNEQQCFCNDDKKSYFSLCFGMLTVCPTFSFDPHSRSVKKMVYISPFYIKAKPSICACDSMEHKTAEGAELEVTGVFREPV